MTKRKKICEEDRTSGVFPVLSPKTSIQYSCALGCIQLRTCIQSLRPFRRYIHSLHTEYLKRDIDEPRAMNQTSTPEVVQPLLGRNFHSRGNNSSCLCHNIIGESCAFKIALP